ncbi:MAG: alginate O-acetyltransferase complex protein AlgI [Halioglobus sp.]|jgi:alginate O-acetyltransferase complex protein AlgI
MLEITSAIFLTLIGSAFYHLIPRAWVRLRMSYVAILSFCIILAYYPVAALLGATLGFLAWLLALLGARNAAVAKYGPFSLIGVLLCFGYQDFFVDTNVYSKTLVQFGLSFYVLRLYLSLRTAAARGHTVHLEEFLTIALFYPIFAAGPICAQEAFTQSAVQNRPLLHNYLLGFLRIGIGIFALYFATAVIKDLTLPLLMVSDYAMDWQGMSRIATYLVMLLNFLDLYANFAGYTEIAIGLGLFFGFEIPENFKYPFMATNIQNFWQRWHLSLSRFITAHIYMPLMLTLRKPRASMLLAFSLVGLWHQVNPQYAVWGVGHGLMLVAYMTYSRSPLHSTIGSRVNPRLWTMLSWVMTMSLVSFFSSFANQPTLAQSLAFTRSLLGTG